MLRKRTLKIFALLVAAAVLCGLPAYVGPPFLEPISAYVVFVPFMSLHLFHKLGIPGLLEHGGNCGWGLCDSTPFGYGFVIGFWLLVLWLAAWGLARLTARD